MSIPSPPPLFPLKEIDKIETVAFSPDGQLVASAGDATTITMWKTATGKKHLTLAGHSSSVFSVAFSPDGQFIASSGMVFNRLEKIPLDKIQGGF